MTYTRKVERGVPGVLHAQRQGVYYHYDNYDNHDNYDKYENYCYYDYNYNDFDYY
jgi:hypothetical protein